MKKSILLLLIASLFAACNNDDTPATYRSWGLTETTGDGNLDYVINLDIGKILKPTATDANYEAKDNDRIIVDYQLTDGSQKEDSVLNVKIVNIQRFAIKNPITQTGVEGLDTLGTDPIAAYADGIWQFRHLLNVPFRCDVSYSSSKKHSFNLVYFPDSIATEADGVYLELRHNANDDAQDYSIDGFLCFDMESVEPFANVEDSVPYTIVVNGSSFNPSVSKIEGWYHEVK